MHKSFVKIYVFMLIIWAVEKSDCKQGAACLSYGHSCWGAHGKRNADVLNNPNSWFLYRMQKLAHKDSSIDQNQSQEEDIAKTMNVFKRYMQRNLKKTISDDTWNIQPRKYIPDDRYYEDQVLDPRLEYKLMNVK
ncbi:uncharacterized protein LOC112692126 isoform X2 [Sipha flava]|uniref:Uncharacterized protein LOC112692126 isoform X2 n=1 Tax=Sipha flava TaxID=143950 RepID=A0A8B8GHU1_9HEMI|nr:uncharacterized protein LOC112692126 isoform X2 [Sipha flava]